MSLDDHVRRAVNRVLAEVRAPLDGTLRGLASTIATEARAAYADAPSVGEESPSWVAAVNRLTRYAGLVLEARTARYLTGAPLDSPAHGIAGDSRGASGGPR